MSEKKTIEIHYQKNPQYRTVHCDGVIGGVTPMAEFNFNFYSTRNVIPQVLKYELTEEGALGQIVEGSGKNGVVREIEFGVYMNRQTAKDIYDYLKVYFDESKQ